MQIDALFELAVDDRHKLKKDWVYVRAVMKPKAPATPPVPAPAEPKA
jgi:hypothetical protein